MPPLPQAREALRVGWRSSSYRARLIAHIAEQLPDRGDCLLLDIGSGDGRIAAFLSYWRPGTRAIGLETHIRRARERRVPMVSFDGLQLPIADKAVDVALLCNVLHHAADPRQLLAEACRVARRRVVIKDHLVARRWDPVTLTLMDIMGNAGTGGVVKARYWKRDEWGELLAGLGAVSERQRVEMRTGIASRLFPNRLEVMYTVEPS